MESLGQQLLAADGRGARAGRRLLRAPASPPRPLPCSASSATRPTPPATRPHGASASTPTTACSRCWPPTAHPGLQVQLARRVDRRAGRRRSRHLQPGRHARSAHRRPLPQHAASRAQPRRRTIATRCRSSSIPAGMRSVEPIAFDDELGRAARPAGPLGQGRTSATSSGTYGEWLSAKVAKVFPELAEDVDLPVDPQRPQGVGARRRGRRRSTCQPSARCGAIASRTASRACSASGADAAISLRASPPARRARTARANAGRGRSSSHCTVSRSLGSEPLMPPSVAVVVDVVRHADRTELVQVQVRVAQLQRVERPAHVR